MSSSFRALVVESNDTLREKLILSLNEHRKLQVYQDTTSMSLMRDYLRRQEFDVVLIGTNIVDGTPIEAIDEVIKIKPLPILYVPIMRSKLADYPKALNMGFIDSVEIITELNDDQYHLLDIPNVIAIKCVILAKLNMGRFHYQINLYLKDALHDGFINRSRNESGKSLATKMDKKIKKVKISRSGNVSAKDVIVIGASTGGPNVLIRLISQFPSKFPAVLVVQHMPRGFINSFANRIDAISHMRVKMAENNEIVEQGTVYIAQGGYHMEVYVDESKTPRIKISEGPTVNYVIPAVDVTLFSAARVWGSGVISVILTGMGHDGREGSRTVKKLRGRVIAQSEEDSTIYGMNKAVIEAGIADHVLLIDDIVVQLAKMLGFTIIDE
ncbi:MAG: hypothetical protein INQ03_11795 [Candidatus Heimdallarchaeota archaeon]|nr:hypothetical protein [Candidatus Heimdallarchaeota archaeon]